MLHYHSIAELAREAERRGQTISRVVLEDQAERLELAESEIIGRMREALRVMEASAAKGSDAAIRSSSGLTGGDGYRMTLYAGSGAALGGGFCAAAVAKAIAISECNASMGRIVAAPTAGSCGILPAVVLAMLEEGKADETTALKSEAKRS